MTTPQPHFAPRRELGQTGFKVTQLGIGDIADRSIPVDTLVTTLRRALDAGLNLIDTAPGYEKGYSEQIVGKSLRQHGRRDSLFLIDKIDFLDQPVQPQVDASLAALRQDYADAFVLHGLSSMQLWQNVCEPGGTLDQLDHCAAAGKLRFIGISSHDPEVLEAALQSGRMDIVMFAVGAHCDSRYIRHILPLARQHGVGTIGFKVFGAGKLLGDTTGYNQPLDVDILPMSVKDRTKNRRAAQSPGEPLLPCLTVQLCLAYTLTCDPDVALLGMSTPAEQDAAFAAALAFSQPLSQAQLEQLEHAAAEAVADKGPIWWDPAPATA
jgi:aryl-alcohol dehydrogenase-like predicted oxidoreductase